MLFYLGSCSAAPLSMLSVEPLIRLSVWIFHCNNVFVASLEVSEVQLQGT